MQFFRIDDSIVFIYVGGSIMSKEKGKKWDGKSRVSNDKYRKRFSEITWKNIDEISSIINKKDEGNPNWLKGYKKWKKENDK